MKILIISDSFKGSLSSVEVCSTLKEAILDSHPDFTVSCFPFSDGGEGFLDALELSLKEKVRSKPCVITSSFLKEKIKRRYLISSSHQAIIESAQCCSLVDVKERKNPLITTSYGIGEMIQDALNQGIRSFIITIGGTSTNDFGTGLVCALGVKFFNHSHQAFIPTGGNLNEIEDIDISSLDSRILESHFEIYADVNNPLLGENGATYTYGPQKGASKEDLVLLEKNMCHLNALIQKKYHIDVSSLPGAGAGGGIGASLLFFCKAEMKSGGEELFKLLDIDSQLKDTDLVITGEGKIDSTTLKNKCISILAKKCKEKRVPVLAIGGKIEENSKEGLQEMGVTSFLSLNTRVDKEETIQKLKEVIQDYLNQHEL